MSINGSRISTAFMAAVVALMVAVGPAAAQPGGWGPGTMMGPG